MRGDEEGLEAVRCREGGEVMEVDVLEVKAGGGGHLGEGVVGGGRVGDGGR